jgi:hypothetical protein
MVWMKGTEVVCGIGPRSHKAFEAKGLRGKVWEDIKQVGRNNVRELRYKGGGRWGYIPSTRCGITIGRGTVPSKTFLTNLTLDPKPLYLLN